MKHLKARVGSGLSRKHHARLERLARENTRAYYEDLLITTVKSFKILDPVWTRSKRNTARFEKFRKKSTPDRVTTTTTSQRMNTILTTRSLPTDRRIARAKIHRMTRKKKPVPNLMKRIQVRSVTKVCLGWGSNQGHFKFFISFLSITVGPQHNNKKFIIHKNV